MSNNCCIIAKNNITYFKIRIYLCINYNTNKLKLMAKFFITCYMGSGKSTAGKKLAAKLDYEFIDLDKFIETECQQTIPEIFSSKG